MRRFKFLGVILIILVCEVSCNGNTSEIDSLIGLLKSEGLENRKEVTYNIGRLYLQKNLDSTWAWAKKLKSTSKGINYWQAKADHLSAIVLAMKGKNKEALIYAQNAIVNYGDSLRDVASIINVRGLINHSLFNYEQSKIDYLKSRRIFKQLNDTINISKVNSNLAMWYQRNGNNDSALLIYLEVLEFAKRNGDNPTMATSYTNIAVIYHSMGQLLKAYEFFVKSNEMYAKMGKSHRFYITLQNIGKTQLALEKYEETIKTLRKVEDYFAENEYYNSIADVLHDKAIAYYNIGEEDSSIISFNKAIDNYSKINNKSSVVLCYIELGVQSDQLVEAKKYFNSAQSILKDPEVSQLTRAHFSKVVGSYSVEHKKNLIGSYLTLSKLWKAKKIYVDSERIPDQVELFKVFEKYYLQLGKMDSAYSYLNQIKMLTDSMSALNNKSNLAEAALSYKYDKRIFKDSLINAQEKAQKDAQIALEQSKLKQQKTLTYASLGGGALLLLLAGSFYNSRQKTRKQNTAIEKRNTQIEWLLKEIHHRVKNNLQIVSSLMSIQGRSLNDEKSKALIRESQNRIKSMSLVHESLYQAEDLSQIEIEPFIKRIAESVKSSLKSKDQSIDLQIEADNFELNAEQAVPVGIIVNELASNAFKHAFKDRLEGALKIAFRKEKDNLTLEIDDDGPALPSDFEVDFSGGSIGMALVQSLAEEQLGGEFEFRKSSKFQIVFPQKIVA